MWTMPPTYVFGDFHPYIPDPCHLIMVILESTHVICWQYNSGVKSSSNHAKHEKEQWKELTLDLIPQAAMPNMKRNNEKS